jgi:hypothetical protein
LHSTNIPSPAAMTRCSPHRSLPHFQHRTSRAVQQSGPHRFVFVAYAKAQRLASRLASVKDYIAEQLANLKGSRFSDQHSSSQVLLLTEDEVWDDMAVHWAKPGANPNIEQIVATWEGKDLAGCVVRLGLPLLAPNAAKQMRASVSEAVRAHAKEHPELFADDGADSDGVAPVDGTASGTHTAAPMVVSPPRVSAAAGHVAPRSPVTGRRSPRGNLSSRSAAAAAAVAALNVFAPGDTKLNQSSLKHLPSAAAAPRGVARGVAGVAAAAVSAAPRLDLLDAGASDPSSDSDSSSDGEGAAGPSDGLSALLHRGGRMRRKDIDHQLAAAGVPRSFAAGFIANAQFAAGGRSMYQLYTDITASFPGDKQHCVRECIALARILDALLREDYSGALESVCRRLGGVHTAAETGNWAMCERLETESKQRSFVPDHFMRSALKSVTQMQAVKKSVANSGTGKGAAYSTGGGKGRGDPRSRPAKKDFNSDNKGSGAAASSKKKKAGSDS